MFIKVQVGGVQVDRFMVRNPDVYIGSVWVSCGRAWRVTSIVSVTPMVIVVEAEDVSGRS